MEQNNQKWQNWTFFLIRFLFGVGEWMKFGRWNNVMLGGPKSTCDASVPSLTFIAYSAKGISRFHPFPPMNFKKKRLFVFVQRKNSRKQFWGQGLLDTTSHAILHGVCNFGGALPCRADLQLLVLCGVVSPSHGPISELNLSELKKSLLIWFQQKPQSILAEQNALFFTAWMYQCDSTLDYLSAYQWIKDIQIYQQCSKHAARRWTLIIEPYLIISLKFKYASSTTGWTVRPLLCST